MVGGLAVAERPGRIYPEVGEIVTQVVGDLSLEEAARRINYAVSANAIRHLKMGKVGWEQTLRHFAEGFWERICELYADAIRAEFPGCECERNTASDWLAQKAGFPRRWVFTARADLTAPKVQMSGAATSRPPLIYETPEGSVEGSALRGVEELDPDDQALVQQFVDRLREGKRPH